MSNLHDNFQSLSGLGDIAEDYDAIFCDIWGVVHNGKMPYLEACEALERFREERGPIIMISNSPQPSVAIPDSFAQLNVPGGFWDAIVTSGDATIDELARRAPGPAFKLGPERDDELYLSLGALCIQASLTTLFIVSHGLGYKKPWVIFPMLNAYFALATISLQTYWERKSKAMTVFSYKMVFMAKPQSNLKACSRNTTLQRDICLLNYRGNSGI